MSVDVLHGPTTATGSWGFPPYVLEQQRRFKEKEGEWQRDQVSAMASAVGRVPQHCAALKECGDLIEASVLALGVSSAHTLITSLNEVRAGLEAMKACWAAALGRSAELTRQCEETMSAMSSSYAALLDKSTRTERELKQLVADRDRKDAALDKAVEYVHCVVAERAAWQQRNGFNAAQLPLEEADFSAQCSNTLTSLYSARDALNARPSTDAATTATATAGAAGGVPSSHLTQHPAGSWTASTSTRTPVSARFATVSSAQNASLGAASASARRVVVSSTDEQTTLSARWRSIQNARHTTFVPSTRLRYVPPAEDIAVLREVLSMGVGSSVLMSDLEARRAAFASQQRQAETQWQAARRTLQSLQHELVALKTHVKGLLDQGIPFIYFRQELLRLLNEQIEREVQRRLRDAQSGRLSRQVGAPGAHGTADFGNSQFSVFSAVERGSHTTAEDDDQAPFSSNLPHFAQRGNSNAGVRPFVFPPRRSAEDTDAHDGDASDVAGDGGDGDDPFSKPRDSTSTAGTLFPTF